MKKKIRMYQKFITHIVSSSNPCGMQCFGNKRRSFRTAKQQKRRCGNH